jgi:hypothetical protein
MPQNSNPYDAQGKTNEYKKDYQIPFQCSNIILELGAAGSAKHNPGNSSLLFPGAKAWRAESRG